MDVRKAMLGSITLLTPSRNYRKQQSFFLTKKNPSVSSEDASPEMSVSNCDLPLQINNQRLPSLFARASPNIFNLL